MAIAVQGIGVVVALISMFAEKNGGVENWLAFGQFGFTLLLHAAIIYGAYGMLHLRRHSWALGSVILAMLPCGGCCILSLPVGIWGLVVLNDPIVKNAFEG